MVFKKSFMRSLFYIFIIMSFALPAHAKKKIRILPKKQIVRSVNDAVNRSDSEQKKIRVKLDFEEDARFQAWQERKQDFELGKVDTKKIKGKKSSIKAFKLKKPDYDVDDSGEDYSGLNSWKGSVDEEPIEIDFESELREVSSNKN
jgi:hypothetical protein